MNIKKEFINGVLAGICIGLGGACFLSCESKVVGSVLFGLGLFTIMLNGYNLYTGKICYLFDNKNKDYVTLLFLSILGNVVGTLIIALICIACSPSMNQKAIELCNKKLELDFVSILMKSFMCDIFVYLAVDTYKRHKIVWGAFIFIPAFILCGFEHSVADMYYFFTAGIFSLKAVYFILVVLLGNTVGGLFLPLLLKFRDK